MKETIENFCDRTCNSKDGKVLVWPTIKAKHDRNYTKKPEKWDWQTTKNYMRWLQS